MRSPLRRVGLVPLIALLALAFQLFTPVPAAAGPPFKTDDPEPARYQSWQVYFAAQYTRDLNGTSTTLPHIELDYGFYPDFQFHLLTPLVYSRRDDSPSEYGYGDTELGVTWRFLDETPTRPMVGTFPILTLPTGNHSRGLGTGEAQAFLPIWLEKKFGPWSTNGGGGYGINPGEGNRNWWYFGWEALREVTEKFTLGAEIYYQTADKTNTGDSRGFTVGAIYHVSTTNHILVGVGRDVWGPNDLHFYIGYQIDIDRQKGEEERIGFPKKGAVGR